MNPSHPAWYWHRLRAMDLEEVAGHLRRRWSSFTGEGSERRLARSYRWHEPRPFPILPDLGAAPPSVLRAVTAGTDETLNLRWRPFGNLDLAIDDPPRWQRDYLAGVDLDTFRPSHRLDARQPPGGSDLRVVWELSRWDPMLRLAQGAWLLGRHEAASVCLRWLEDWTRRNPPFRGWNWTSALESALRLVQLSWIDALLRASLSDEAERARLERAVLELLPAHLSFTWSQRSFGSSANNHLLGELTGLLVAAARWPSSEHATVPIDVLHRAWEREVLAQFAGDGGNREQALHYHLFALELCLQATQAIDAVGRAVSPVARERIARAASFYAAVQTASEPWDYGDGDDAVVTRFHAHEVDPRVEWRDWIDGEAAGEAIAYWLGPAPREPRASSVGAATATTRAKAAATDWTVFVESGIALRREAGWTLRLDASPLGYLATAAHGHLDALHLSVWLDGVAIVIDPGTGTYYADRCLREILASRRAHNGPCPIGLDRPRRLGVFLWAGAHDAPTIAGAGDDSIEASSNTASGTLHRTVRLLAPEQSCVVADAVSGDTDFWVRWQLAPGATVEAAGDRAWFVTRGATRVRIAAEGPWAEIETANAAVSPSFRTVVESPYLAFRAGNASSSRTLTTTFRRAS